VASWVSVEHLLHQKWFHHNHLVDCHFYFKPCIPFVYDDDTTIAGPTSSTFNELFNMLSTPFKSEQ
jgi:hypothetical protein